MILANLQLKSPADTAVGHKWSQCSQRKLYGHTPNISRPNLIHLTGIELFKLLWRQGEIDKVLMLFFATRIDPPSVLRSYLVLVNRHNAHP